MGGVGGHIESRGGKANTNNGPTHKRGGGRYRTAVTVKEREGIRHRNTGTPPPNYSTLSRRGRKPAPTGSPFGVTRKGTVGGGREAAAQQAAQGKRRDEVGRPQAPGLGWGLLGGKGREEGRIGKGGQGLTQWRTQHAP
jgi:hypothetical protein